MKIPDGIKIIECENIRLSEKDIVEVKNFSDLILLVGAGMLFKMNDSYYMLTNDVAYVHTSQ